MKRTSFAVLAVAALALITANTAFASDPSAGPSHTNLAHRNADRQQTYQTARSLGLSHSQTDRLTNTLQHQQRDDQQTHRSATRNAARYNAIPSYGSANAAHNPRLQQIRALQYRFSGSSFQNAAPSHGNYAPNFGRNYTPNYGYPQPAHNNSGLSISTPGFSIRLGH